MSGYVWPYGVEEHIRDTESLLANAQTILPYTGILLSILRQQQREDTRRLSTEPTPIYDELVASRS